MTDASVVVSFWLLGSFTSTVTGQGFESFKSLRKSCIMSLWQLLLHCEKFPHLATVRISAEKAPSSCAKCASSTAWLALSLPWLQSSSSLVTKGESPFWQGCVPDEEGATFSFSSCQPLNLLGPLSIPPFGKVGAANHEWAHVGSFEPRREGQGTQTAEAKVASTYHKNVKTSFFLPF